MKFYLSFIEINNMLLRAYLIFGKHFCVTNAVAGVRQNIRSALPTKRSARLHHPNGKSWIRYCNIRC